MTKKEGEGEKSMMTLTYGQGGMGASFFKSIAVVIVVVVTL